MNDAEYSQFLYDRAARRDGYTDFADQCAETDAAVTKLRGREEAEADADMQAWAKAQLDND